MFKVLIVEDERRTARSIAQLVEEHPSFTVAGLAANGMEALTFLGGREAVNLVLTDIRMPGMDGMQLLEVLQKQYPRILSVVLSGYSEFAYARTAIQCGAFNYLLKPVDQDDLFRMLDSVREVLDRRRYAEQQQLLQRALDGMSVGETPERYSLLLAKSGLPRNSDPLGEKQHLRLRQCFRGGLFSFPTALENECLLIFPHSPAAEQEADAFFRMLDRELPTPVHCLLLRQPMELSALHSAKKHLHRVLEQTERLFCSDFQIVDRTDTPVRTAGTALRDLHPDQAAEAICSQNSTILRQCLNSVLSTTDRRIDVQSYLLTVIRDPRLAYRLPLTKPELLQTELVEILSSATEQEACLDRLTARLIDLQRDTENRRNLAELADEIQRYLDANYHLPINGDSLSRQFGLGPRHLSKVFKQYKNVRPTEYLLRLRMDRAKKILETKPDAMVKDVANSVGYSDPLYFSRIFKKETGLWPTEYQAK